MLLFQKSSTKKLFSKWTLIVNKDLLPLPQKKMFQTFDLFQITYFYMLF